MSSKIRISNYHSLLQKVSHLLEEARRKTLRQINTVLLNTYWQIGKLIVEEEQRGRKRADYGEELIKKLAKDLSQRFGKGFGKSNLFMMRRFYLLYPPKKFQTLSGKSLSWSHICELLLIKDSAARAFYEVEAIHNNWSVRELKRQINSMLFERLSLSKDKKKVIQLSQKGQVIEKPEDAIKDPYVLEFLGLPQKYYYTEKELEQKLIDHLQDFILELGKGFTFVGRQRRITIDNEHYYIDLVFYHRILRCLVLIDLKIGKLEHKDIGQMNFYLNYIKDNEMLKEENPPIGIILCTEAGRSKVFVEYALGGLSNKLFVSRYKLYLPTKKELEEEIKKERKVLEMLTKTDKGSNQ
jgi:predicted nuclease of restriction endonuclease-like (RecB) superfamily